jgi:diaminopimelate epimerase
MQGIGNDFVIVDALRDGVPAGDLSEIARAVNDRRFGVGGDGLILVERGNAAPYRMRMFNPDGSESEMCGNGVRCFAKLLIEHGHTDGPIVDVETGAGVLHLKLMEDGRFRVDMGEARLTRGEIGMAGPHGDRFIDQAVSGSFKGTAVSMGNPHLVIFVDDVARIDLHREGPLLEHHELFPKRVNVHFASPVDRGTIVMRTWERGAGATLACGTGACSVAVAGFLTGRTDHKALIHLPGGDLQIEYIEDGHVFMTGPAETVFEGRFGP